MDERLSVLDLCHCFGFRTAQLISGCKPPNNGTSCRVVERTQEGAGQWTAATERGKGARQFWPRSNVREGVTDTGGCHIAGATLPVPREPILGLLDRCGSHAGGIYLGRLDDDLGMLLILLHWLMATVI